MMKKKPTATLFINTRGVLLHVQGLPLDVKDQFKAWCAKNHTSMSDKILELMYGDVKHDADILKQKDNLRTKFGIYCARRGWKINERLTILMKETIKGGHP